MKLIDIIYIMYSKGDVPNIIINGKKIDNDYDLRIYISELFENTDYVDISEALNMKVDVLEDYK